MHFPIPTHITRLPKAEQPSARLRFIVQHAMLQAWNDVNFNRVCREQGYNHSSVVAALQRGYMTERMADAFVASIGKKHICRELLLDPMTSTTIAA